VTVTSYRLPGVRLLATTTVPSAVTVTGPTPLFSRTSESPGARPETVAVIVTVAGAESGGASVGGGLVSGEPWSTAVIESAGGGEVSGEDESCATVESVPVLPSEGEAVSDDVPSLLVALSKPPPSFDDPCEEPPPPHATIERHSKPAPSPGAHFMGSTIDDRGASLPH
jgi:hypothetical protein